MIDVKVALEGLNGEKTRGLKATVKYVQEHDIGMIEEQIQGDYDIYLILISPCCWSFLNIRLVFEFRFLISPSLERWHCSSLYYESRLAGTCHRRPFP